MNTVCTSLLEEWKDAKRGDPEEYTASRPPFTEAMAVDDALRLAAETGVKYYGMHTTCREAVDVFSRFQREGYPVKGETCTQYTSLDASQYESQGCLPVIAPPFRRSDDNDALFEALRDGLLDVVSTDHVAFKQEDNATTNWWDSKFGSNGLQTSLPVFHDETINQRGYSYPFLVRVICTNPARLFGLSNKGRIRLGADADIVIFDPNSRM